MAWDARDGRPASNAIVWQDTRTAPECRAAIERGWEADVRARSGLPISTYFSATKIRWLLDHVGGRRRARALGRPDARDDRHLGDLEPDRRPARRRARDGSDQRLAHAAVQPRQPRVGPGALRALRRSLGHDAADPAVHREGAVRLHRGGRPVRRADPRVRQPRRSAGGARGTGLLRGRRSEEHLRDGVVPARARRRQARRELLRTAFDGGLRRSRTNRPTPSRAPWPCRARPCSGSATASA